MTRQTIQKKLFAVAVLAAAAMIGSRPARADDIVVTNTDFDGPGSFKQAIDFANYNLGPDTINFAIPGSGTQTIFLPVGPAYSTVFTDAVYINGWSQGGDPSQGPPLIELRCSGAASCLTFLSDEAHGRTASWSTVTGIIISETTYPYPAIQIGEFNHPNQPLSNVRVEGCYIGTDALGTGPGRVYGGGVWVKGGSHNQIGGAAPSQRNVISAVGFENYAGIMIDSDHNIVEGNYIGLDRTGTAALPNNAGVLVYEGSHNRIGGTSPGQRNVISGNTLEGIGIQGGSDTVIEGNYIGTQADGVSPAGNGGWGVGIDTDRNQIGGANSSAGNVIADNAGGIFLGNGAKHNTIGSNLIGVGADGLAQIGNHGEGILIYDGSLNSIGGVATGKGLLKPHLGNTIAFNNLTGIRINEGTGNLISRNSIYANGGRGPGLGIDLAPLNMSGVTPNDDCDLDMGPNRLQNFPIIDQVLASPGNVKIAGVLLSSHAGLRTGNGKYEVEFFWNDSCSASGNGQGQKFLGSTTVSLGNGKFEGSCSAKFEATFNVPLPANGFITATATDSGNNTSEFSACFPVVGGPQ